MTTLTRPRGQSGPGERIATNARNGRVHDRSSAGGDERLELADREGFVVEHEVVPAARPVPANPAQIVEADALVGAIPGARLRRLDERRVQDEQMLVHERQPQVAGRHRPKDRLDR